MKLVEMVDITKVYENGACANQNVSFDLEAGEIHAIAGENGAGKSTIMKILYGLERASAGKIFIRGVEEVIASPLDAVRHKIGYVHQHFMLVNELTVFENIFLGFEVSKLGVLRKSIMRQRAKELCEKFDMNINIEAKCGDLSVGEAQKTEILKALSRGAEILILDEPTAVLTPQECEELFIQLDSLKELGCSIVIITHRLKEIKRLCDRVTIMRKGKLEGVYNVADVTEEDISRLMVGSDVHLVVDKAEREVGEPLLVIEGLTIARDNGTRALDGVSLRVHSGEIVCLAGVEGNGQREVVATVTGSNKTYVGEVEVCGKNIRKLNVKEVRDLKVSHIPEDRMSSGANLSASIYDNLISVTAQQETKLSFIRHKKLKEQAAIKMSEFDVRADSMSQSIGMLSGGNMQKVVVARELSGDPKLIVADQPTRGVDVGAIEFIHKKLVSMRDSGCGVLLVSADLGEVKSLADRILVFYKGEIMANITSPREVSDEQLGRYMLGLERQEL